MILRPAKLIACSITIATIAILLAVGPSRAEDNNQDRPANVQERPAGQPDKPAEEVYKNIQIFKGVPSQNVMRAMGFFRRSLGVQCTYCHVPPAFEKDEKPAKLTARKMYRMVQAAQKEIGSNKVSCYMCHRGHAEPEPPPADWQDEMAKALKQADPGSKPAEQVYSNIQVLKGVPSGRIMAMMAMFTRSLGVECSHCHVDGEFEKDDKPAKQTARKMLRMTQTIGRDFFDGTSPIGCYTCHRGQREPVAFPAPASQSPEKKGA